MTVPDAPPQTLLSTDALPVASVLMPRELTPAGAPEPIAVEPPVRSAAATTRRLLYLVAGLLVAWPILGWGVVPLIPAAHKEAGVIAALVATGVVIFAFIALDHDKIFARRRRAAWLRAFRALGGDPTAVEGDRMRATLTVGGRRFVAELGCDDYGLECLWLCPCVAEDEARAELSLQRRSTARRFWPTGDPDFDARVAVHGPLQPRVALLDAAARDGWARAIAEYDVDVTDGRLYFSLAYAPRTTRTRTIARLIEQLAADAARCIYRPAALDGHLAGLLGPAEPPAVAANALRTLRADGPARPIVVDAQALLLADPDPWRRALAAEVVGDEDTLVALLAHDAPDVRARAVDALIELWPLDGLAARLDLLLDHPEGGVRGSALTALGRRSLPLADGRLEAAAADPDLRVAHGLLDWLSNNTGPRIEAALVTLLSHPEVPVVHRAADRLGRVGGPDAELVLIDLTRQRMHRRAARNALLQLRQRYPKSLGSVPALGR